MILVGDFILSISLFAEVVILLWFTSIEMIRKKRISEFIPFALIALLFGVVSSMGFFSSVTYLDIFFVRVGWFILVLILAYKLWRIKWN